MSDDRVGAKVRRKRNKANQLPNVLAADHWNFAMAVAWICWRSPDAAREVWPRWGELQSLNCCIATVFRLRSPIDNVTAPPAVSIDAAIADLLSRLRSGDIRASFRGEPIAPEQWLALSHDGYLDGPHYVGTNRFFASDWEILMLRSEILELWRETSGDVRKRRGRTNVVGAKAKRENG